MIRFIDQDTDEIVLSIEDTISWEEAEQWAIKLEHRLGITIVIDIDSL